MKLNVIRQQGIQYKVEYHTNPGFFYSLQWNAKDKVWNLQAFDGSKPTQHQDNHLEQLNQLGIITPLSAKERGIDKLLGFRQVPQQYFKLDERGAEIRTESNLLP